MLYVEDDEDARELVALLLRNAGFEVCVAASLAEGLRVLRERRFCLILADYNLPDGTGSGMLAEAWREGLLEGSHTCLCTAHPFPERDVGFDLHVLTKPVDNGKLIETAKYAATESAVGAWD